MSHRRVLRIFAAVFACLAISDVLKPLELSSEMGFIFLGRRLHGAADLLVAPAFGAYLAVYSYGLWNARRFALPIGILYAGWVPLNMDLFTLRSPEEMGTNSLFGVTYMMIAIATSWGAMATLFLSRGELQ